MHTAPNRKHLLRLRVRLTGFAAQVVGAPGGRALDVRSTVHRNEVVGARVERAERFAALGHLARVVEALHLVGILDRNEAVGAADGVAEQIAAL